MRLVKYSILFMMTILSVCCFAQKSSTSAPSKLRRGDIVLDDDDSRDNPYRLLNDSIIILTLGGVCKGREFICTKLSDALVYKENGSGAPHQEDLLKIHGNVVYNFNYRSFIDTPFQQTGMVQHMVQTYMDGDIAGKYPFRAVLTYRASNSPYFSNSSDISVQYRQSDMLEKIKSDLRKDVDSSVDKGLLMDPARKYTLQQSGKYKDSLEHQNPLTKKLYKEFDSLYAQYVQNRKALDRLQQQSGNQSMMQAIIEDREAKLYKQLNSGADSIADTLYKKKLNNIQQWDREDGTGSENKKLSKFTLKDSASGLPDTAAVQSEEAKFKKIQDSINILKKTIADKESKILLFQKKLTDSVQQIKRRINQLNDPSSMTDYLDKNDTTERNRLSKVQKLLLSVNQIGIGRSWVNYSDLTVSNVSLNGFNIEMNPGNFYLAIAAGSVNSQFQDFILNNNTATNQSVKLLRLGIGKKNSSNFIFTMYTGRKAMLNTTGINDSAATQPIVGASISSTKILDKNTTVTLEYARSSYADAYDTSQINKGLLGRVLNFKMNTNEAWAVNFKSIYPLTNTKIDGSYRKMGEAFQSFTIYATNVKQDAFLFHVNQLLCKKELSVDASIRKNNFNSPLTAPGYSNTNIFKSLQVSLAIPHYPFVSIGYYPSSQLFTGSNNIIYQSWYNTLNVISSHTYKAAKLNMSTSAVYTKFYNNQSDTSFAYFNASSFSLTHSIYLSPFIFQGSLTVTDQIGIHLITVEPLVTWQYNKILSLTGSLKWSRLNSEETLWGGTAGVNVMIPHFGSIQLHYDKVHLPAYNGSLIPVDMGRITFNREF
jgi:hypothetical protein